VRSTRIALRGALFGLALTACSGSSSTSDGTAKSPTSEPTSASTSGSKGSAPNFTLTTTTGENVSLSDYLGKKVILVDFWATTCAPCMVELPHIVQIYEKYKEKGFIVLAVAGDGPETRAQVDAEVHAKKMTFPVLLDEETTVISRFSPKKDMPFWVLIDRSGNVVKKKNGYDPGDEKKLAEEIEKLLQ
jgi:peroxiredoxin